MIPFELFELCAQASSCEGDHLFCRLCVRRGCEVQIGDNQHRMTCFQVSLVVVRFRLGTISTG